MANRPPDGGPGNRRVPRRMLLDKQSTSREDGCAKLRAAAGSAMVHLSKCRRGVSGDAIADQPPDAGTEDPRPAVGCGQTIVRHLSALSCSL